VHNPVRSDSRRGGTHPCVRGAPPALPADGEFPAVSRSAELTGELLDVTNESELEDFLGGLVAETAQNAGGRIPAGTGRALVEVLRKTAGRTLPTLTTALGDEMGSAAGPTAETAARVYGMELEGMSAEDRDYEIARQFVRFAQAAAGRAARTPAPAPAAAAVDAAVAAAGREFAPGLLPSESTFPAGPQTGPWVRRGNSVVLIGVEPLRL
jgi:hypothetical protein